MSHFTRVATRIVDETCLRTALTTAGYSVPAGPATIGGWNGQSRQATVGIPDLTNGYGVGFDWEASHNMFSAVADWSELAVHGVHRGQFLNKVTQLYGVAVARSTMEPQGFSVVEQTDQRDGSIRILLRRVS